MILPKIVSLIGLIFLVWLISASATTKALIVTGGDRPEYALQAEIISKGISERCNLPIVWDILEADKLNVETEYDIVIHHQYFPQQKAPSSFQELLESHKSGVPALILNGALNSFVGNKDWYEFCGAEVKSSGVKQQQSILLEKIEHSILKNLSTEWVTSKEESSVVVSKSRGSLTLARAEDSVHPVFWTRIYNEKARVFATSLGVETESIKQPQFLDLLASSFVWALNKTSEPAILSVGSGLDNLYQSKLNLGNNLLVGQMIASSSDNSDRAIDGDPTTQWTPSEDSLTQWLFIEMDRSVEAKAMAISWENKLGHPYRVEASADSESWVEVAAGKVYAGRSAVVLLPLDLEFRYLRLSNPLQGAMNPIWEIAVYSGFEQIPHHVRTFSKVVVDPLDSFKKTMGDRKPILVKSVAFSILDDEEKASQWELAFDELSLMYETAVVDGLLARVKATHSGKFRHGGLLALGRLYRDREGHTWQDSKKIARFLELQLANKRIDPEVLLSIFTRHRIPANELNRVFNSPSALFSVKQLQVKLLSQNLPLPASGALFLRKRLRDQNESVAMRIRSTELLAGSTDVLGLQDAFMLVAKSANNQLNQARNNLLYNTEWEQQLDWLISKTKDKDSAIRRLAWKVIIRLLDNFVIEDNRTKDFIIHHIALAEQEQGSVFLSFLDAMQRPKLPIITALINKSLNSDDKDIAWAAILQVRRLREESSERIKSQGVSLPIEVLSKELSSKELSRDASNGELIYQKRCAICHKSAAPSLKGEGKLTTAWLKAILIPNSDIKDSFSTQKIVLIDGHEFRGFIGNHTPVNIELIDQVGNSVQIPRRSIVTQLSKRESIMPRDLTIDLNLDQYSNLIAYLKEL